MSMDLLKDIKLFLFVRKEAFPICSPKTEENPLIFFPQCIFCANGETLVLFQEGIQEHD